MTGESDRFGGSDRKLTVALVFGGRSSEHTISCATAGSVLAAIDRERFSVIPVGITRTGTFVLEPDDSDRLAMHPDAMPSVDGSGPEFFWPTSTESSMSRILRDGELVDYAPIDVVLPLLHGAFGEDGTLQGMLELTGIPYAASGVLASALSMDKAYTKIILRSAGIRVSESAVVTVDEWSAAHDDVTARAAGLGYPVFVKPARSGSSVGVTKVEAASGLAAALEIAFAEDTKALIEEAIVGREVECGVLEGAHGSPTRVADSIGEIKMNGRAFYDFEAKYLGGDGTELVCPTDLTDAEADSLRSTAAAAFDALGCRGLARVDFFLTESGPVVNEVNTLPGFTPISMFPTMWQCDGLAYPDIIAYLIDRALEHVDPNRR